MGPIAIRDLGTGDRVVDLEGQCTYVEGEATMPEGCSAFPEKPFPFSQDVSSWSADGRMIAVTSGDFWAVWDARDGRLLHTEQPAGFTGSLIFTPDSKDLIVTGTSCPDCNNFLESWSTETWRMTRHEPVDEGVRADLVGFTQQGSILLAASFASPGDSAIHWFDARSLKVVGPSIDDAFESRLKSWAIESQPGAAATGTRGGVLRVWDLADRSPSLEVKIGDVQIQGVAFIDDEHLALTPQTGGLLTITLDPDELVSAVRKSLTRAFSAAECQTYGIDPAPRSMNYVPAGPFRRAPRRRALQPPQPRACPSPQPRARHSGCQPAESARGDLDDRGDHV